MRRSGVRFISPAPFSRLCRIAVPCRFDSMFIASKFLSFLTQPIAWAILLLLSGLLLLRHRRKTALTLCWTALGVLLFTGWEGPVDKLIYRLEIRHAALAPDVSLQPYVGIVVLGGALSSSKLWEKPGNIALNSQAERMVVPIPLMQRYPHLRMVFTGGEGDLKWGKYTEADRAKIFFDMMGVDPARVVYESASRTTYDNAVLTASLPGVDPTQSWLLLTTAAHMPRSMGVFRKAGWNVTPYPVDFRSVQEPDWGGFSMTRGVEKWQYVLHESIGYLAYWLAGRI
jgi:uncharacterized SAM-binding protein YcdF (DUF218 family)